MFKNAVSQRKLQIFWVVSSFKKRPNMASGGRDFELENMVWQNWDLQILKVAIKSSWNLRNSREGRERSLRRSSYEKFLSELRIFVAFFLNFLNHCGEGFTRFVPNGATIFNMGPNSRDKDIYKGDWVKMFKTKFEQSDHSMTFLNFWVYMCFEI